MQLATSAITAALLTMLNALEQSVRTSQLPVSSNVRALRLTYSAGYGDPNLPHLSVDFLQPLPPLSHGPCRDESPPCHTQANRPALSPQCGEARLQEELPELHRERVRLVEILRQKAVMPLPISSRLMSVWMMDCR